MIAGGMEISPPSNKAVSTYPPTALSAPAHASAEATLAKTIDRIHCATKSPANFRLVAFQPARRYCSIRSWRACSSMVGLVSFFSFCAARRCIAVGTPGHCPSPPCSLRDSAGQSGTSLLGGECVRQSGLYEFTVRYRQFTSCLLWQSRALQERHFHPCARLRTHWCTGPHHVSHLQAAPGASAGSRREPPSMPPRFSLPPPPKTKKRPLRRWNGR